MPSLAIAYLATDERHGRRGAGRLVVSYAITLARTTALDGGCRVALANSEPDVVGFYEKMGFAKFNAGPPSRPRGFWHWLCRRMDARGKKNEDGYLPMYFDIGVEAMHADNGG